MLPSLAKQIKTEATGYCSAHGCTCECVGANSGQEILCNVTAVVFTWWKSPGKAQTWRVCWENLDLGNHYYSS